MSNISLYDPAQLSSACQVLEKANRMGVLAIVAENVKTGEPAAIRYTNSGMEGAPEVEEVDRAIATLMEQPITHSGAMNGQPGTQTHWPARHMVAVLDERLDDAPHTNDADKKLVEEFQQRLKAQGIAPNLETYITPPEQNPLVAGQLTCLKKLLVAKAPYIQVKELTKLPEHPCYIEIHDPSLARSHAHNHENAQGYIRGLAVYLHSLASNKGEYGTFTLGNYCVLDNLTCLPVMFQHDPEAGVVKIMSVGTFRAMHGAEELRGLPFPRTASEDPAYVLAAAMAQNGVHFPGSSNYLSKEHGKH